MSLRILGKNITFCLILERYLFIVYLYKTIIGVFVDVLPKAWHAKSALSPKPR